MRIERTGCAVTTVWSAPSDVSTGVPYPMRGVFIEAVRKVSFGVECMCADGEKIMLCLPTTDVRCQPVGHFSFLKRARTTPPAAQLKIASKT